MISKDSLVCLWLLMLPGAPLTASDWPQFLGPNRDGSSPETGLLAAWNGQGPKVLWKVAGGEGYAQIGVSGQRAFTVLVRNKAECVVALDVASGKEFWSHTLGITSRPGSTPTIDGERLYVQSARGVFICLEADSGKVIWQ